MNSITLREFMFLMGCMKAKYDIIRSGKIKDIVTPMFYTSKKYDFSHYYISKNACTFMRGILYSERFHLMPTKESPKEVIHWSMADVHGKEYIFPCSADVRPDGKIKFMVYRDPIKRFVSAYKELKYEFETGASNHYIFRARRWSGLSSFTFDVALRFARAEHFYAYPYIEQHIARQALYYNFYKRFGVDYIVDISNLNKFLEDHFGICGFEKLNSSKEKLQLTPTQTAKIRDIYKEDFEFLKTFHGDKTYL